MRASVALCLVGTIQITVFARSLSNFTCTLLMMRGGTLLIFGQRSRSTLALGCIKPCGQDPDYSFWPITFKLHMQVVDDERRNPIDFGSKVNIETARETLWVRCRLYFLPDHFQTSYVSCWR